MIYLASSWRNREQPIILEALRQRGYVVYDFKQPQTRFHWSEVDPDWENSSLVKIKEDLQHPLAQRAFNSDFNALVESDIVILLMPCGRSAHLELGYAIGSNRKKTAILLTDGDRELMWDMVDYIATSSKDLYNWLEEINGTD